MTLGLKEKTKFSILNLLLILFAFLQALLQFLELIFAKKPTGGFLNLVLSIGQIISTNWVAVSISLIFTVLGCLLYNNLLKKASNGLKSVGIMFINLALCLRVYSSGSLSEKITYLGSHMPAVAIVSAIILLLVTVIIIIRKAERNKKEFNKITKRNRNAYYQHLTEDSEDGLDSYPNNQDINAVFRLKHPFLYAYYSFTENINENRKIKREHQKQTLEIQREAQQKEKDTTPKEKSSGQEKVETIMGYVSIGVALALFILAIVFFKDHNNITQAIQNVTDSVLNINNEVEKVQGPLTGFLLSSGVLFLFGILALTIILILYSTIRVFLYILSRSKEDAQRIEKISKAIKSFVFGVFDGALRPLLFLPDFLECLENVLLDVNMEESISKGNSNNQSINSQNNSKEQKE